MDLILVMSYSSDTISVFLLSIVALETWLLVKIPRLSPMYIASQGSSTHSDKSFLSAGSAFTPNFVDFSFSSVAVSATTGTPITILGKHNPHD